MNDFKISPGEVESFLKELFEFLNDEDFDIEKDFFLMNREKNRNALVHLGYNAEDIVDRLKELTVKEYFETKLDVMDDDPPALHVFGKYINGCLIYIKLKITEGKKKVLCVSFHDADEKMIFPYA